MGVGWPDEDGECGRWEGDSGGSRCGAAETGSGAVQTPNDRVMVPSGGASRGRVGPREEGAGGDPGVVSDRRPLGCALAVSRGRRGVPEPGEPRVGSRPEHRVRISHAHEALGLGLEGGSGHHLSDPWLGGRTRLRAHSAPAGPSGLCEVGAGLRCGPGAPDMLRGSSGRLSCPRRGRAPHADTRVLLPLQGARRPRGLGGREGAVSCRNGSWCSRDGVHAAASGDTPWSGTGHGVPAAGLIAGPWTGAGFPLFAQSPTRCRTGKPWSAPDTCPVPAGRAAAP